MYNVNSNPLASLASYRIDARMLRYSIFVPKLYNLCKSLGFEAGKIMPSRAFCSDESQGYPIILIAKHFQTFPFNHGMVGGIVATDRHGPHADHGNRTDTRGNTHGHGERQSDNRCRQPTKDVTANIIEM